MYPFVTVSKSTIFVSAHGCPNSKMVNGTNSEYLPKIVLDFLIQVKAPTSSYVVQKTVSNDYCSITLNYNDVAVVFCSAQELIFLLFEADHRSIQCFFCCVLSLLCFALISKDKLWEIYRNLLLKMGEQLHSSVNELEATKTADISHLYIFSTRCWDARLQQGATAHWSFFRSRLMSTYWGSSRSLPKRINSIDPTLRQASLTEVLWQFWLLEGPVGQK